MLICSNDHTRLQRTIPRRRGYRRITRVSNGVNPVVENYRKTNTNNTILKYYIRI